MDCGGSSNTSDGWETFSAVVAPNGSLTNSLRLTNDGNPDENPQIAAVNFGTDVDPDQKFVLGWHTVTTSTNPDTNRQTTSNDILLAAVGRDGTPYTDFPDSLSGIGDSTQAANVGSFRFARGEDLKLTDLSLVWVEPSVTNDTNYGGGLDAQAGSKDSLKAVKFYRDGETARLTGELSLAEMPDYTTIDQFGSYYGASAARVHTMMLSSCYDLNAPGVTTDSVYTTDNRQITTVSPICAMQAVSGGSGDSKTGSLNLDFPDTGISKVELVGDEPGKRTIQATLQNLSDIPIKDSEDRRAYAAFYTDQGCDENKPGRHVQRDPGGKETDHRERPRPAEPERADHALRLRRAAGRHSERGRGLYGKIWVEKKRPDGSYSELVEYDTSNNMKNILIPNPVEANNGQQFRVTVEQDNSGGATVANLTIKNLSMEPSSSGNVVAQLLDAAGNVVETKLLADSDADLISLGGEERPAIPRALSMCSQEESINLRSYPTAGPSLFRATAASSSLRFARSETNGISNLRRSACRDRAAAST